VVHSSWILLYFTGCSFLVKLTCFGIYIDLTAVRKLTLHILFHYLCIPCYKIHLLARLMCRLSFTCVYVLQLTSYLVDLLRNSNVLSHLLSHLYIFHCCDVKNLPDAHTVLVVTFVVRVLYFVLFIDLLGKTTN